MELLEHPLICHGHEEFLLFSRTVQELLIKDQNDSDAQDTAKVVTKVSSRNPKLFNVPGKAINVVDYVTPNLDSLTPEYFQQALDDKEDLYIAVKACHGSSVYS